jgi:S-DNA-T family DNA segregation ATPase FtsK/SpoIIIE
MAAKDNRKRGEVAEPSRWSNEITGILWITGGLLLLLSLIKYSPADLPRAGPLEAFAAKNGTPGENLIGPVGGILGFVQILLFGAASYLVPVGFIWFGVMKLAFNGPLWPRVTIGFVALVLAGAAWLHAADFFFKDWAARCLMTSPGGVIGNGIGGFVLMNLIGRVGTLILTTAAYLIAMILITGQQPVRFTKACWRLGRMKFHAWRESRSEAGQAAAREAELLAERERQREQRRKEREAMKTAAAKQEEPAETEDDGQALLPLRETPAPQIIDASQRRAAEPILPGAKPFERKKPSHQSLSVGGFENYELPGFDLLDADDTEDAPEANRDELLSNQRVIIETLKAFGIDVTPGDITRGPTITRYEIYPSTGLRVSRIAQLEADIARATCAERINILAPIPGKDTVGIEIANSQKIAVPLHELLHDPEFRSAKKKIPLALGKDVYGKTVIGDLAAMPHLLVAGATGSGKSVCINSIIASMLFKFGPDELRFIMVDPKVVEMQMYNRLPTSSSRSSPTPRKPWPPSSGWSTRWRNATASSPGRACGTSTPSTTGPRRSNQLHQLRQTRQKRPTRLTNPTKPPLLQPLWTPPSPPATRPRRGRSTTSTTNRSNPSPPPSNPANSPRRPTKRRMIRSFSRTACPTVSPTSSCSSTSWLT